MSSAPRYLPRYTLEDYRQWSGDWELVDGIPVAMSPSPFGPHQEVSLRLASLLLRQVEAARCDAVVLQELDWVISSHTVVRPDVVVLCGPTPARHLEKPPALIAEVLSAATADRDRHFKRDLYQEQGVPHYLVVDPEARTLQWMELNSGGHYVQHDIGDSVQVRICDHCDLAVNVDSLFR